MWQTSYHLLLDFFYGIQMTDFAVVVLELGKKDKKEIMKNTNWLKIFQNLK